MRTTTSYSLSAAVAAIAIATLAAPEEARAADPCLLDRNGDGDVTVGTDNDGASGNDEDTNRACGVDASATGGNATAIGSDGSVAGTAGAVASDAVLTAVGADSAATGTDATAIGAGAQAGAFGTTSFAGKGRAACRKMRCPVFLARSCFGERPR